MSDGPPLWKAAAAEMLGTFVLTFAACAGIVAATFGGWEQASPFASGLAVSAMIYTLGPLSGAHINPAATFAFALRGAFPWPRAAAYWLAQLAGGVLAAVLLRSLFGTAGHVGATLPQRGTLPALVFEVVLTFVLVFVIVGTATEGKLVGPNAGIAVGFVVILDGLVGAKVSGASMNPARSLGPALVAGELGSAWVYVVGPLLGATVAVGVSWLLMGGPRREEKRTARGKPSKA